ncbi:manganese efflux pump MntP family protein [Clostridium grantii]|uniref:Putative manganese efflux pump MntP n=1 Tax=Clostridium grantii DSM 8605 TaxID=1121316 RepID=A0A1M5UVB9_9CLOT|nr:manganese efflux pump [Clostridium grantii]SHH66932.1 Putative Mn2+ efflux pump MntP [Clostridium grantii DSM 8605]
MSIYSLFIIALALSLDAFGVMLCIGLNRSLPLKNKFVFISSFGFFQFLFSYIGAYAGSFFNEYVVSVPTIVGGIIIAIVGILMIKEGLEHDECKVFNDSKMYYILGISVSIDAAVIGFTILNNITVHSYILLETIFIGIITLIMCTFALLLSKYLRTIDLIAKYADYLGGVILILFGLKMIFF